MKKYSRKDKRVVAKMSSLVDELLVTAYSEQGKRPTPNSNNMPFPQDKVPEGLSYVPEPLLYGEDSGGWDMYVDGESIHNPEYHYDVDVPIYQPPERTGDGYAPIQRPIDPQYDQGYAPGTKTRSEEGPEDCGMGPEVREGYLEPQHLNKPSCGNPQCSNCEMCSCETCGCKEGCPGCSQCGKMGQGMGEEILEEDLMGEDIAIIQVIPEEQEPERGQPEEYILEDPDIKQFFPEMPEWTPFNKK